MDRDAEHTTQTASPRADTGVLKKYGNRRLYDTTASRYVTLVEVEAMVQRGVDIQVVDAKSGDDITKEVLVQLLLERDGARASLPTALLKLWLALFLTLLLTLFVALLSTLMCTWRLVLCFMCMVMLRVCCLIVYCMFVFALSYYALMPIVCMPIMLCILLCILI